MALGGNSAENTELVSRDRVIDVVRRELRNATVVSRRFTVEEVAAASKVPLRTVRSYMANDPGEVREPTLSNALSLACVLGTGSVNAVLAVIGYGGACPLDEPERPNLAQMTAHLISGVSVIATAAADGRIDHIEEQPVREAADMIIAEVLPFSSAGHAA